MWERNEPKRKIFSDLWVTQKNGEFLVWLACSKVQKSANSASTQELSIVVFKYERIHQDHQAFEESL